MIDAFKPALRPSVRVRHRSDGSAGVWNPETGHALEVAHDEAPLLDAIDGQHTLAEIAEAYSQKHGFVPFTALKDLLGALGHRDLLANSSIDLERAGLYARRTRLERFASAELIEVPLPAGKVVTAVGWLVLAVAASLLTLREPEPIGPYEIFWFYLGASVALSARAFLKSAVAAVGGHIPIRLEVVSTLGIVHLAPDTGGATLLDKGWRILAHAGALLGAAQIAFCTSGVPGLAFGAAAVVIGDLCPFEPTSAGQILGALSGRVDLREHARAYLSKRLLSRAAQSKTFDGEIALIMTLVLSLGWFSLIIQALFKPGLIGWLSLLRVGIDHETYGAFERGLAFLGFGALTVAMPLSLLALVYALFRAGLSLRPARESQAGQATGTALQNADLKAIPVFSQLAPDHLSKLAEAVKEVRYPAKGLIVRQGDPGDRFFAIRSGEVAIEVERDSGLARDVAHLGPGDCFGETALLEQVPRTAHVRALKETVLAVLSRSDFEKVRASLADVDITHLLRAAAALHKSRFFAHMPSDRLSALAARFEPRQVAAGTEVVKVGERGSEFYLVGAGTFDVLDPEGKRVGELRPGDHFGEIALLRDLPRNATVRATQEALLLALPKEQFIRAMAADLTLSARLEALAAERSEELSS